MKRAVLMAVLVGFALAGQGLAQPAATIENLREKSAITDQDRQQIRSWVTATVGVLVGNTDPDRRGMVAARDAIINEGRKEGRSPAFFQAFGDEAVAALKDGEKKAVSQDARVNLMMAVAELRRTEGLPILQTAVEKDPYPAVRYGAAKGLSQAMDAVLEKNMPRLEGDIADSIGKVIDTELPPMTLYYMFETLGRSDHEKAHDVLADALTKWVPRTNPADPVVSQILDQAVQALERGYAREVRPEAKARILMAFATMCTSIMAPTKDPYPLFATLNASLEKITGEKVGFVVTDDSVMQKVALLEWVEKFVKGKKIPKRPALPPAVEQAVKEISAGGAAAP